MIKTKLFIPQVRPDRIQRPRISAYLDAATRYPLTLVSSLAGSGKTTALAEWVRQIPLPAAWFSIDEGDNDLNRFLVYFVTALQTVVPGAGQAVLEALRSPEPLPVENLVAVLINDLAGSSPEFVLVLDDYHQITSRLIHQAIFLLIEHIPAPLHLVMATRADPNLPLARLRARNNLLELRLDQLRFTPQETAAYLNQAMQLGLSQADLDTLWARTEGWIASLQLAALSLKTRADGPAFIQAFSGSSRYLFDYLVEEVLDRQPGEIQTFLLETCILERMCAPLCEAVTGLGNGQETLDYLERNNLFLVPLDDERGWYRYHHLFIDLLRARLAHTPQGNDRAALHPRAALHLKASLWWEKAGRLEEAIQHALAAQDYPRAAGLVEKSAENAWLNGQYALILTWVRSLPEPVVRSRPWLCLWTAWAYTQTGTLPEIQRWIEAAEQAAGAPSPGPGGPSQAQALADEIATLHAFAACLAQDVDRAARLSARVLQNPAPSNQKASQFARCNILHALSSMEYAAGELAQAGQTCLETIRLSQEIGFPLRQLHAVNKLAYISKTTGQLYRSYRLLQETLSLFEQPGAARHFATGSLYCRLVDLLYEWNRLEEARQILAGPLQPEGMAEIPYLCVDRCNLLARQLLIQPDFPEAQKALDQAALLARKAYIWPGLTRQTQALQVRLWLQTGAVSLAGAELADLQSAEPPAADSRDPIPFSSEGLVLSQARLRLAQNAASVALPWLERLARSAQAGGRHGSLIEIHLLQSQAWQGLDEPGQAAAALQSALRLAEPEGYVRTFLDEASWIPPLLAHIARDKSYPQRAYAARLLAACEQDKSVHAPDMPRAGLLALPAERALIEPLSKRELEVLACMAEGLSNHETARRLVIETSTVKRHINTIFAKLGVTNRVQAINQARQSGLL